MDVELVELIDGYCRGLDLENEVCDRAKRILELYFSRKDVRYRYENTIRFIPAFVYLASKFGKVKLTAKQVYSGCGSKRGDFCHNSKWQKEIFSVVLFSEMV